MVAVKTHHFILTLSGVDEETEGLEDALFKAGCDDALINFKNGCVYLDFDREATTLEEAILSAINAVKGIGAMVTRVTHEGYILNG